MESFLLDERLADSLRYGGHGSSSIVYQYGFLKPTTQCHVLTK